MRALRRERGHSHQVQRGRPHERVARRVGRLACHHLDSVTINNDPPSDFGRLVENDRAYFDAKWNGTGL
ncbi:MAG: hypothetical protein ACO3DM_04535 [Ilumatobacteraceae bacterium]